MDQNQLLYSTFALVILLHLSLIVLVICLFNTLLSLNVEHGMVKTDNTTYICTKYYIITSTKNSDTPIWKLGIPTSNVS